MFHTYILLIGTGLPTLVSASIFPTQPVQATVWSENQPMLVSWVEDWKYPLLNEMGLVDISLWGNTDTYLASLASGVDPMTKTREVTVPGQALRPGSTYTLRFTTSKPVEIVIYSADFAIIPANATGTGNGAAAFATTNGAGTRSSTDDDSTVMESGFKTVPTGTGSSSTWTTTTATSAGRIGSTTPSGVPPPSGTIPGGGASAGQHAASAGRRGVDVEKLKFQFVFMVWPVLMGITMAL